MGHGKLGKSGVAYHHEVDGVKGTGVINWGVANPYCYGNWTR